MNRLQSRIVGRLLDGPRYLNRVNWGEASRMIEEAFDDLGRDAHRRIITTLVDVHPAIAEAYDTNPELHAALDLLATVAAAAVLGDTPLTEAEQNARIEMVKQMEKLLISPHSLGPEAARFVFGNSGPEGLVKDS